MNVVVSRQPILATLSGRGIIAMGIALIEPIIVQDIFVSGVIPENMGDGTMRFTGYVQHKSLDYDGVEYVVVNRVIRPIPSVIATIKDTMRAVGISCCGGERLRLSH